MAIGGDEHSQGGGYRGGPKRWTGTGPRPARHIPWPEIFKHHQSVLVGHVKMMDMIRKHTTPGTGNYKTANDCVNRAQEALKDFKQVAYSFVPPRDNIDRVPLGASSASMYPGYSPADHVYGEAAQEFGSQVAEDKKKGKDWKPPAGGPEYVVGQSTLSEKQQKEAYKKRRSESEGEEPTNGDAMEGVEQTGSGQENLWFMDSNPTPVSGTTGEAPAKKEKRKVSFSNDVHVTSTEASAENLPKKKKSKTSTKTSAESDTPIVEELDISDEVEARLKAKEEKRGKKEKKEMKRKRESADSSGLFEATTIGTEDIESAKPKEKPKKKKQRSSDDESENDIEATANVNGNDHEEGKVEKKHKKKNKKRDSLEVTDKIDESGPKEEKSDKKKRKKSSSA